MVRRVRTPFTAVVALAAVVLLPTVGHAPRAGMRQAVKLAAANRTGRTRRGRPRKFTGPSRAVTLTLPEDVIAALRTLDSDLSRAIVRSAQPLLAAGLGRTVQLVDVGDRSVIAVPWSRALQERTGVELIPFHDGRALIALGERLSPSQLELKLGDAIADPALAGPDRVMFEELAGLLRNMRRDGPEAVQQRRIIVV